jgi:UDP-N-acetylmuramoyl-tripeptide--D-alanyl-D-alanine ligase
MRAALETLRYFAQERGGSAWAFLGKMHELGSNSESDHRGIVDYARKIEIDNVIAINAPEYGIGASNSDSESPVKHLYSFEEALQMSAEIAPGDVILVKGSRAEGLEKFCEMLKESL